MMKRIISMLLVLAFVFGVVCTIVSCGEDTTCSHTDTDENGKCDKCGEVVGACSHTDTDENGKCDKCGEVVGACSHTDTDENGKCDKCGEVVGVCSHTDDDENDKCDKCGDAIVQIHDCCDENGDSRCDVCDDPYVAPEDIIDYPWDKGTLLFHFTDNDNNKELSSGCRRYLAGDLTGIDASAKGDIDTSIKNRNDVATAATGITVQYLYWPNNSEYGWGNCVDKIAVMAKSKTAKDAPDVYVDFFYDLMAASIKGCFANLKGTSRENGNNYFEFNAAGYDEQVDNRGYMNEWMNSVTLSTDKTFILASDYFIDMVRASYVIPIGVNILEEVGPAVNGTDDFTLQDFYDQVWNMEWTYTKLMEYSAAAYSDDGVEATSRAWIGDERIGFACSVGGVAASGLLYTTDISLINSFPNDIGGYDYYYPNENGDLLGWADALKDLFGGEGVIQVPNYEDDPIYNQSEWGNTSISVIRKRFSQGHVLFGDITMLGWLEDSKYQSMRDIGGFGVTVVPLYKYVEGDRYLTQIHNVARPGAIADNTKKFEMCTAYLNYQSTHSTDILNEYYTDELMYNVAGSNSGTVRMLQYVRQNIRTSFDKTMEDAAVLFAKDGWAGQGNKQTKMVMILTAQGYNLGKEGLRREYASCIHVKQSILNNLLDELVDNSD